MKNISEKLISLMNYRIEQEEASSRLYKAMAVWLDFKGFSGAAKLFNKYAEEEMKHAGWAYQYLLDLDVMPAVPAIEKPIVEFGGLVDIINKTYEHEQKVTEQCQALAAAAFKDGDYMTLHLAQHYLDEQIEELAKSNYWVNRIQSFGSDGTILFEIDEEMGEA
jgi:ferritin